MIPRDLPNPLGADAQIVDLELSSEFQCRPIQEGATQKLLKTLRCMMKIFAQPPDQILRDIADAAVSLCNADSAGVSVETRDVN